MKKIISFCALFVSAMVALAMGATGDSLMAAGLAAGDGQGDGDATAGSVQTPNGGADGGAATVTGGQEATGGGESDLYERAIDEVVLKIDPMSTPLLQISSYATSSEIDAQEFEYWSAGPRINRTVLPEKITAATVNGADRFKLKISDKGFCTKDDTIRVVGKKGWAAGSSAEQPDGQEDLVLFVINVDEETGYPVCCTVNGKKTGVRGAQSFGLPYDLEEGTVLIRMGKSCGELDAQTGRFHSYPEPEIQYTQNFMFQVEQSTFEKISKKKVRWDFSDIEEAGIRDMKIAQENTYLFGVKRKIRHPNKENLNQYFTGGLWWQAGKDLTIGHQIQENGKTVTVINDDDLVSFARKMFVGSAGNKRKVMLCGSAMLEKFGQIRSDRFRLKETVDIWDLTFSRFHTDFGDVLVIYDEQLDINGMSAYGFCIDPEYIKKKVFLSMQRNILDLKKSGQRNSESVVVQEVAGCYLQYADAHARVQLAGNDGKFDWQTAAAFDFYAAKGTASKVGSYNGTSMKDAEKQTVERNVDVTGA